MPAPTQFQIKCAAEAMGIERPDLANVKWLTPETVKPCIRCQYPVVGDRCPHCRAHQDSYR